MASDEVAPKRGSDNFEILDVRKTILKMAKYALRRTARFQIVINSSNKCVPPADSGKSAEVGFLAGVSFSRLILSAVGSGDSAI